MKEEEKLLYECAVRRITNGVTVLHPTLWTQNSEN
jgi:hypothetical protein